jgi:peptide/nickel transport system permease protein
MNTFLRYVALKALFYIISGFLVITFNFVIIRLIPGNPVEIIVKLLQAEGINTGGQQFVIEYEREFGLTGNILTQYVSYLTQLLHGNLGISISHFPLPVSQLVKNAIPWSIGLLGISTLISFAVGTFLGALIGWRSGGFMSSGLYGLMVLLSRMPYYILGLMLAYVFAFLIPIFPSAGAYNPLVSSWPQLILSIIRHATLPALSLVISQIGWWAISMRALVTTIQGEDFIVMAKAKGITESRLFRNYVVRPALPPQFFGLMIAMGNIVSGSLLVEVIFAYPGVGYLLFSSIEALDYTLIQGIFLTIVFSVLIALFLVEVFYPLLDPRARV